MRKLLLLPCFFISLTSFAQTKLIIQNSNEPWGVVNSQFRNSVISNQSFEAARTEFGSKNGDFYTIRSFLQFDLSTIPAGSKINAARLDLFGGGALLNLGPNNFLLRRITSAWSPAKITWNTQPSTATRGTIQLPASMATRQDYKNINVWTLVQAMVDSPSNSYGFALRLDTDLKGNTNRSLSFESPQSSFPHKAPRLVIEYTPPGMQSDVTSMSVDINGVSAQMTIFPNPAHGAFTCNIKSSTSLGYMFLRVVDILGRTVYSQLVTSSNQQIKVSLPIGSIGTYFAILQDNSGPIIDQQLRVN